MCFFSFLVFGFVVVLFCETLELKINKELFGAQNSIQLTKNVNFLCFYNTGCRIVQHCTTILRILLAKFTVHPAGFAPPARLPTFPPAGRTRSSLFVLVSSTNVKYRYPTLPNSTRISHILINCSKTGTR